MSVNLIAVLVGAVINMVIGSLWYSKMLFGAQWMKLVGISEADMKKNGSKGMVFAAITALIVSYVLAKFVIISGASSAIDGAKIGFWVWVIVAGTSLSMNMFEGKSLKIFQINATYQLVTFLIIGGVLAVMR